MANEFKHKDPGAELTSAEYIASSGCGHIFACQATGDIVYASSTTVLSKLAKGAANTVLHMGGSCIPAWTASPSVTDLTISGGCITLTGAATDIDLIDNNASALSFDASGKTGIIDVVTTNCSEGVTMSGTLGVTGVLTATGGIELSHACQNTLTGSGGVLSIQGNRIFHAGGTDVPVADGGTGASCLTDGGILLGSGTSAITAMAVLCDGEMIVGDGTTDPVAESGATLRTSIGVGTGDSPQFTGLTLTGDLSVAGACITLTGAATDVDLIDNNACALSFDASGQAGILAIDTQNCAEGVKMSGKLTVTGAISTTGAVTVGACDTGLDVKFFGASAGAFMLYDQSCDLLEIRGATAAGPGYLKLTTGEATVVACDVLGKIEFQAPAECGTDAIVAGANIQAVAQATFSATVNNTDLLFMTGLSGAATEKFRFTANGELGVGGANYGTDGQVLTSTGAGTAAAWEDAAGGLSGLGSTDNAVLRANGTGGATAQGSSAIITDAGLIQTPDGCDATPGYAFKCSTGTGMFSPSTNLLAFTTGGSGGERMRMGMGCGWVGINESVNANMHLGLTINMGAKDSQILAFKSSDVAHGLTGVAETDTFGAFLKNDGVTGGLNIRGLSDAAGNVGLFIDSHIPGTMSTAKTTSGNGYMGFRAFENAASAPGSDQNLVAIRAANTTRFIFDTEGTAHADVGTATYDDECDVEVLRGFLGQTVDGYKENYQDRFGKDLMYNLPFYEENKLIGKDSIHWEKRDCGKWQQRAMVNMTGLTMLHHSTIIQLADNLNARIDGIETQLKALTEGK
jgi:hypothetical protein